MLRRTHPNHFTTVHTDYSKEQTPFIPREAIIEEAHAPHRSMTEPIKKVMPLAMKQSRFQKRR
jgi:hypothetical protein